MKSNDQVKQINIKNRACYYFDDIIKVKDFYIDNILIDEKSNKNIFFCNISYKTLIGAKPVRSCLDKIDKFILVSL